ncbi:exodeoxyribonuclease III [Rarobacter faecitabidus]|uniref:Exodeoxyribonuclease-3 n=1 Tax=Rarobacter faecitabidus TaxID=13243 RepID=A0A542ZXA9_RARFA|nr:exodeoxyribonuclease III [Rarobacter faecitabidus]TQL64988.1 exodeoxyribonuclease-3 [Rarobacter faecitabidus]
MQSLIATANAAKMDGVLTIATVNLNGIRAAAKRGLNRWIDARRPDVLLLQEVRAPEELVLEHLPGLEIVQQACRVKGRAGVAIATALPINEARVGLGLELEPDVDTGRWVEADITTADGNELTVISTYIHSGTAGTPKMDMKYSHLERVTERLRELAASGRHVVVAGDINIAHQNVDIKNWRGNLKAAGFLPEERAYLDIWFDEIGFVDLGRRLGGPGPGPYTWWSWRGQAFDNDAGWRIDYQLATPGLAELASNAVVDRAATYDTRFSDHAPLLVDYDL